MVRQCQVLIGVLPVCLFVRARNARGGGMISATVAQKGQELGQAGSGCRLTYPPIDRRCRAPSWTSMHNERDTGSGAVISARRAHGVALSRSLAAKSGPGHAATDWEKAGVAGLRWSRLHAPIRLIPLTLTPRVALKRLGAWERWPALSRRRTTPQPPPTGRLRLTPRRRPISTDARNRLFAPQKKAWPGHSRSLFLPQGQQASSDVLVRPRPFRRPIDCAARATRSSVGGVDRSSPHQRMAHLDP